MKGCSDSEVEQKYSVTPRYIRDLKKNGHKLPKLSEISKTMRVRITEVKATTHLLKKVLSEL